MFADIFINMLLPSEGRVNLFRLFAALLKHYPSKLLVVLVQKHSFLNLRNVSCKKGL